VSLINDMLKDLDARRPDRRRNQAVLLEGLGAVRSPESGAEGLLRNGAWLSFALLVLLVGITLWGSQTAPTRPMEPGALMLAEAIKLLDSASPALLPEVSLPAPRLAAGPAEVRDVALEWRQDRTRLIVELSRETGHVIERDPSGELVTLILTDTRMLDALPALDLSGTPVQTIDARQVGADLRLELDLSADVRSQSTMLASAASARVVVDFYAAQTEAGAAEGSGRPAPGPPSFEKRARPPSLRELAVQTHRHAAALAQQDDIAGAINALGDAVDLDPQYHPAREALASMLLHLGRSEEAVPLLENGLTLDPEYAPFVKLQARALAMQGALVEAVELLRRFERAAGDDPEYQALLAALYQRQGEHARALTYYQRVLRSQSDKAVWWMGLGISLEGESKRKEALAAYRAASLLGGLGADSQRYIGERIAALQRELK